MKKQTRTTKTIEVNVKDHYLFSVMCLQEDLTQADMFNKILEDFRTRTND